MQIVRFTTKNSSNNRFQEQKISLTKLSQIKTTKNNNSFNRRIGGHQYDFINQTFSNQSEKKENYVNQPIENQKSHIVFQQTLTQPFSTNRSSEYNTPRNINQPSFQKDNKQSPLNYTVSSNKKFNRKKIFQNQALSPLPSEQMKENIQLPTFKQMPYIQLKNQNDHDQTKYFSMIAKQENEFKSSKKNQEKLNQQFHSPFKTNQQNSRYSSPSSRVKVNNLSALTEKQHKAVITEVSSFQIPRLEEKLKKHDKQLQKLKKYLLNAEKYRALNETITEYHKINEAQKINQHQMIHDSNGNQQSFSYVDLVKRQNSKQIDQQIRKIQDERIRRLNNIQRQNDELIDRMQTNLRMSSDYHHSEKFSYQNQKHLSKTSNGRHYKFDSQDLLVHPSQFIHSNDHSFSNMTNNYNFPNESPFSTIKKVQKHYQKGSTLSQREQVQVSPVLKRQMNEISSIGFNINLSQQNYRDEYSLQANTFREILSPLQFQGQNNALDSW